MSVCVWDIGIFFFFYKETGKLIGKRLGAWVPGTSSQKGRFSISRSQ